MFKSLFNSNGITEDRKQVARNYFVQNGYTVSVEKSYSDTLLFLFDTEKEVMFIPFNDGDTINKVVPFSDILGCKLIEVDHGAVIGVTAMHSMIKGVAFDINLKSIANPAIGFLLIYKAFGIKRSSIQYLQAIGFYEQIKATIGAIIASRN